MAFDKGHDKLGGRKKGSLNKKTEALKKRIMVEEALSVESTVEAIRRGQNYDLRDLFDDAGNLKPLKDLTEEQAWAIAGFEVIIKNAEAGDGHTDKVAKVKLVDRGRYVELAARHQGMLNDKLKVDLTAEEELVQALLRGRKRASSSQSK